VTPIQYSILCVANRATPLDSDFDVLQQWKRKVIADEVLMVWDREKLKEDKLR
jgi:hypothetical protein